MRKILAVDFDGTLCTDNYPNIGEPIQKNIDYVLQRQADGWIIILNTCRRDFDLYLAVEWCKELGIQFDYYNENADEAIKQFGGDCRKIFADEYLDDKNVFVEG